MKQNNLAITWPLRTADNTKRILAQARNASTETEAEEILKSHGLRDIDVRTTLVIFVKLVIHHYTFTCRMPFGQSVFLIPIESSLLITCTMVLMALVVNTYYQLLNAVYLSLVLSLQRRLIPCKYTSVVKWMHTIHSRKIPLEYQNSPAGEISITSKK